MAVTRDRPILFAGRMCDISSLPTWFADDPHYIEGAAYVVPREKQTEWVKEFIGLTTPVDRLWHPHLFRFIKGLIACKRAFVYIIDAYPKEVMSSTLLFLSRGVDDSLGTMIDAMETDRVVHPSTDTHKHINLLHPMSYQYVDTLTDQENAFISIEAYAKAQKMQYVDLGTDNLMLEKTFPEIFTFLEQVHQHGSAMMDAMKQMGVQPEPKKGGIIQ